MYSSVQSSTNSVTPGIRLYGVILLLQPVPWGYAHVSTSTHNVCNTLFALHGYRIGAILYVMGVLLLLNNTIMTPVWEQ